MRRAIRAALSVAALSAATGALAQGLFDDNEARRRVELLRQSIETGNRAIEERLTKIEGTVANSSDRNAMIELSGQLEALRGEISRMRGQIEVLANQVETADKRQKDLYLDIDTRLRKLEQTREQQGAQAEKPPVNGQSDVATCTSRRWLTAIGSALAQDPHPLTDPPAESSAEPFDR